MATNTFDIQKGMDVYGSNGAKIGTVAQVWPTPSSGASPPEGTSGAAERGGPTASASGVLGSDQRVDEAQEGSGVLGSESGAGSGRAAGVLGNESQTGRGQAGPGPAAEETPDIVVEVVSTEPAPSSPVSEPGKEQLAQSLAAGGYNGAPTVGTGWFQVDQGGFAGIGATHLYFPFDVVQNVVPGDRVNLTITKDEADKLYARQPDFLTQGS